MWKFVVVAIGLAGCGLPYPETAPFDYTVAGIHFRSAVPLSAAMLECNVRTTREEFSTIAPVEEFDRLAPRLTVWVREERYQFDTWAGQKTGAEYGGDIILTARTDGLLHEIFHAWEEPKLLPTYSHPRWKERGLDAAAERADKRLRNCPDSPYVVWTPA